MHNTQGFPPDPEHDADVWAEPVQTFSVISNMVRRVARRIFFTTFRLGFFGDRS